MDLSTETTLKQLAKHYYALSPSTPTALPRARLPSPEILSLPSTQDWLVQFLLQHAEQRHAEDGATSGGDRWRNVFWKRIVLAGIEEGFERRRERGEGVDDEEVHPSILNAVVRYLSSAGRSGDGPPGVDERIYYWGSIRDDMEHWNRIRLREDGKMISVGTTGLRTWQASIVLSNYLISHPSLLSSEISKLPIIELGSGAGLLSLVTACLQQDCQVVATDVDDNVLDALRGNILLNGMQDLVTATRLDWEWSSTADAFSVLQSWEETTFTDHTRPALILGADIVYDPSLATHLATTLAFLLRPPSPEIGAPKPEALIAGTIRNESTWEGFIAACCERGMLIEEIELNSGMEGDGVGVGDGEIVGAEGWEGEGEVKLVRISLA